MRLIKKNDFAPIVATIVVILLATAINISAQKASMRISATAMGTNQQLGRIINIDIWIYASSTPDDQKGLLEAFGENGSEGLANALEKMGSKGRIAVTGTLGFDLKYVRVFKMNDGSLNVRFVTDRPVTFAERWAAARTTDYSLAMGEIFIKKGKDKSSGRLMPVARLQLNKDREVEVEAFQNPWNLTNIRVGK